MNNDQVLRNDTLRYKKNKLPANLALLALVFNCLYFCLLYAIKTPRLANNDVTMWVTVEIGISVLLTLVTLLVGFLCSEGIKGYNKKFCIPLLVLAAVQIIRIFGYPLYGLQNDLLRVTYFWIDPSSSVFEFIMMLIWLLASAACYIASAVIGYINIRRLEGHIKAVESGEVDIDKLIKEDDAQSSAKESVASAEVE
ncbi:MAG: hypothetical protein ACI4MN_02030 [Candidatus Coproplasma sp.]